LCDATLDKDLPLLSPLLFKNMEKQTMSNAGFLLEIQGVIIKWRAGWDSNPRYGK